MKSQIFILLALILAIALSSVSAVPECSFTCTDGVKVILPNIETKEICDMAVNYAECPVRKVPDVDQYCIPWCYPCNQCTVDVKVASYSFVDI
ncbi:hypothetical protein PPL_08909 [Heterostelium album PN500]|uniref:Uncharacterized protein n=1 Tax=Heterostelium pallidum (strain ATCC 26659 / Pp 5 / PN500) TaxID=670386 RepID=D3BK28_HETP5|nr:hypothetical protein PPL_08909 [Heterostelium album PN500]EFA78258.1 hypothetical protein PPL_08909 [Heterostelium album PN500]|eukprot:XP_020430383.1 hypothetical protein PPL_08909 [Heterostelium album PN500]